MARLAARAAGSDHAAGPTGTADPRFTAGAAPSSVEVSSGSIGTVAAISGDTGLATGATGPAGAVDSLRKGISARTAATAGPA